MWQDKGEREEVGWEEMRGEYLSDIAGGVGGGGGEREAGGTRSEGEERRG